MMVVLRHLRRFLGRRHGRAAEVAMGVGGLVAYNLVRARHLADRDVAIANARRIVAAERRAGVLLEPAIQRALVRGRLSRTLLGAAYIVSQVVALPIALRTAHTRRYPAYPALRTMALLSWAAGVAWYARRPVAPPRMLPELGIADSVSEGFLPMDNRLVRSLYNPYAAMPSLHVGMAPVVAWTIWASTTNPAVRIAAVSYPPIVAATVVATGQHFLADIAGGIAVVLPAWAIARRITRAGRTNGGTT
ncbi:MAG: phosphatase PAP2 family protein [Thermoleophilia bacterium]